MTRQLMKCNLVTLAVVLATPLFATSAHAQTPAVISWEPYTLHTYDGKSQQIDLGRIQVPVSRTAQSSPSLSVAFFRLKSSSSRPGSPIVFLMGGPGIPASVMAPIPPYWALFDSLRSIADVILLDQRGIGLSSPKLDCPAPSEAPSLSLFTSRPAFVAAYTKLTSDCVAHFRAQGIDPTSFSDVAIADDVEGIRRALASSRVSLLGFSYGTRIAMTFIRRYPDRVDRVLLQGPTDEQTMYRSARDADSLFARIAAAAAVDSASAPFSQGLVERLRALLKRASRQAIVVRIRNVAGDSVDIPIGQQGLAGIIMGRIADPRIPALIATLESGDVSILKMWVESSYNDLSKGVGSLMGTAIRCSQLPGARRVASADTASARSIFGGTLENFSVSSGFCSSLGKASGSGVRHLHVPLHRPALFVLGTLDDRTPRTNLKYLQPEFANSTVILVENGGHELLPDPGVRRLVVDFFRGRDVRGRSVVVPPPRYLSLAEAHKPPRRPGQ